MLEACKKSRCPLSPSQAVPWQCSRGRGSLPEEELWEWNVPEWAPFLFPVGLFSFKAHFGITWASFEAPFSSIAEFWGGASVGVSLQSFSVDWRERPLKQGISFTPFLVMRFDVSLDLFDKRIIINTFIRFTVKGFSSLKDNHHKRSQCLLS